MLALSGGGARGFAHIGVLEVLLGQGLPLRGVVGTSMGAVIAAMALTHRSTATVHRLWREAIERELVPAVRPIRAAASTLRENPLLQAARRFRNRLVVSFAVSRRTILDGEVARAAIEFLVPDVTIESLRPPFVAVATDLGDGSEARLTRGSLRQALLASSAIPGFLPAVRVDDRLLVDGGVVAEVPVAAARAVGWPVVAVDVSMDLPELVHERLVLDTMMRTQMMTASLLRDRHLRRAQEVVRPAVGHAAWSDWHLLDELVEAGRRAARRWLGLADPDPGT